MSSIRDARILLNMTNQLMQQTAEQKQDFFEIFCDVVEGATGFESSVEIPTDSSGANEILS